MSAPITDHPVHGRCVVTTAEMCMRARNCLPPFLLEPWWHLLAPNPGFEKRVMPDGATDAGADVLRRSFVATPPRGWQAGMRRHAVAVAATMLAGMIDDGWTITPPKEPT